jgi:hypothetical protein
LSICYEIIKHTKLKSVSLLNMQLFVYVGHKWLNPLVSRLEHFTLIQIIQSTRCKSFTSLLLDIYVWLNMFRASPCPSSVAHSCTRRLWFYRWREAVRALLVVVWQTCQTTTNNAPAAVLQRLNQRLLVQLYAPDDGRRDARNMSSDT